MEDDDIDQTAVMALIGAVQRFDSDRGYDFLAYAVPTIRGEIKRHFRDHGWTIRVPRRIQETQQEIDRAQPDIDGRERRSNAGLDELALLLGISRGDVSEALTARGCFSPSSLDLEVNPDSPTTLGGSIPADDSWVSSVEARFIVQPLVRQLSPRDQRVLLLRYVQDWTQESIADELGVTQMQVSRILVRIHGRMREVLLATQAAS